MRSRQRRATKGRRVRLLLDERPARVAWSLRRVRTDWAGSAIQVQRLSDNALLNVGFVGNDLDTAALLLFAGSSSLFIRTFYDHSGNGFHAVQTTIGSQARIVNAGTLDVDENGKVAPNYDGVNDGYSVTVPFTTKTIQAYTVSKAVNTTGNHTVWSYARNGSTDLIYGAQHGGADLYFGARFDGAGVNKLGFVASGAVSTRVVYNTLVRADASAQVWRNGTSLGTVTPGTAFTTLNRPLHLGNQEGFANYHNGSIQEAIFFDSEHTEAERDAIRTDIRTYWGI